MNRELLRENRTGHWALAENRIFRGDVMFVLLQGSDPAITNERELYAGRVIEIEKSDIDKTRKVIIVEKFYKLDNVVGSVQVFLEGKKPLAGNRVLTVWKTEDIEATHTKFERSVKASQRMSKRVRERRLANAPRLPARRIVSVVVYDRNPDVVATVLERANGRCEKCGEEAPFKRKSDNTPYLEVHHIQRLADNGEDTVDNAEAVCPNCHREYHFGA